MRRSSGPGPDAEDLGVATLHERRVRILEGARRDPIATEAWFVTTVNRIFTADSDDEDDD